MLNDLERAGVTCKILVSKQNDSADSPYFKCAICGSTINSIFLNTASDLWT